MHDVPEPELFVEEGSPSFPVAVAVRKALLQGSTEEEFPALTLKEVAFANEAEPDAPSSAKPRSVNITVDRILRFKETPGCKGCAGRTRYQTC